MFNIYKYSKSSYFPQKQKVFLGFDPKDFLGLDIPPQKTGKQYFGVVMLCLKSIYTYIYLPVFLFPNSLCLDCVLVKEREREMNNVILSI